MNLGDDAGGSGDANDGGEGHNQHADGTRVVGRLDEVALEDWADIGGEDRDRRIRPAGSVGERCRATETDDSGDDDEGRRKEGDHRGGRRWTGRG